MQNNYLQIIEVTVPKHNTQDELICTIPSKLVKQVLPANTDFILVEENYEEGIKIILSKFNGESFQKNDDTHTYSMCRNNNLDRTILLSDRMREMGFVKGTKLGIQAQNEGLVLMRVDD